MDVLAIDLSCFLAKPLAPAGDYHGKVIIACISPIFTRAYPSKSWCSTCSWLQVWDLHNGWCVELDRTWKCQGWQIIFGNSHRREFDLLMSSSSLQLTEMSWTGERGLASKHLMDDERLPQSCKVVLIQFDVRSTNTYQIPPCQQPRANLSWSTKELDTISHNWWVKYNQVNWEKLSPLLWQ